MTFFVRLFLRKHSTQDNLSIYKEIKGNPFINKDKEGNPLPSWVNFPDISPFDFFYREAGEFWLYEFWTSFWEKMSKEEQVVYLDAWDAPEVWRD